MKKLLFIAIILGVGAVGLSYFKNTKITSEFLKQIDKVTNLTHGKMTCTGFIKADCSLENIAYKGTLLADSMTLRGIDPMVQPTEGEFITLPLEATIHNAKFSLFDISAMLKDNFQQELQSFFKKYTTDYDIHIKAEFLTDGRGVRDINIIDLFAEDKITPFHISTVVKQLDTFPVLETLHASFDVSHKRLVFFDFMKAMRKCCKDKFPERYLEMSDIEIWDDMVHQTVAAVKLSLKGQFNQGVEVAFMKALLDILEDQKNAFDVSVTAKKPTPLEQTVMMFFIAGPDSVKDVYDIQVKAK